jgi:hypothetical protein
VEPEVQNAEFTPPPSWVEVFQRAHLDGATALTTFQGMLADEIVIPKAAFDAPDPMAVVRATIDYSRVLEDQAFFVPGEYALEAFTGRWAIHYVEEVRAGGHLSYGLATHWDDLKVRAAMAGFRSMSADPYMALLKEMKQLVDDPKRGKKYRAGYGANDQVIRDLDKRFADLEMEEPIAPRFKMWVKSLRKVKYVEGHDGSAHLNRIASGNRLFYQRRAEAQRAREARERSDPAFTTARALCEMAGVLFLGLVGATPATLREHWSHAPNREGVALNVSTDHGTRTALVFEQGSLLKKRVAVLLDPAENEPLTQIALSREDYEAIFNS